ncbi:MAG: hypothetical protein COY75_04490 [Nitrospirae bacterium CG_4_10_14_0_8_um_filter_41_23]|nr:hypothetical protein [Nitrospirota bacterium]OIP58636.1 MAG: hypothetical protein AUK38_07590 [Nitrospirae bacterium CG2_30_41_42]PIQ93719.1 MAG: hypothetical protein COV68_08340 [Nitrospirae bacterium CG11_big_fil_rev_8_21_14_0_20_41_14]PIV44054.1 MAG: hypothetical protein COS27_03255 [Nitrospirae bacterium CG02_land_8_20_14_3_00_41_53]PIW87213.1 MAG: hypothetical protein COZ94_06570 [Nitrospirae bacterium CG_4_8_14_3_um_filter_41_47]PIY87121.1 MAG: hypothetical protein COY75_04490 [Nitros
MSSVVKSIRIDKKTLSEVESLLHMKKETFSSLTSELITEAVKMRKCPGIVFIEGPAGRRARIEGTGIDVWELISAYQELNNDLPTLKEAFHWLTDRQIMAAIGYAKTYPDEIKKLIEMNRAWSKEKAHAELPSYPSILRK